MSTLDFDKLATVAQESGVESALEQLAGQLAAEGRAHELFDVRLTQARQRLGIPVIGSPTLEELADPVRTNMEEASLAACREAGHLLLEAGRPREAWMYLRPLGERASMVEALERLADDEALAEDLLEVALREGVHPRLGFQLVLRNYGLCNAITMYDSEMHQRSLADKQAVVGLLLEYIHEELLRNVQAEITREQGSPPAETTLASLVADRDWLFANENYHVDTTHLAAVVRFSLTITDPKSLALAVDLCAYGRHLSPTYQFPGDAPFTDTYPSHSLFFQAQLGQQVDEAVAYFEERARGAEPDQGNGPAEVYVALLARLGRWPDAFDAALALYQPNVRTSGFAPGPLELGQRSGQFERLLATCRERNDIVGFAAGLAAAGGSTPQAAMK